MRNLSDEQVTELGYNIVLDHLYDGIEYIAITESVDDSFGYDDDGATDEDYRNVSEFVSSILTTLRDLMSYDEKIGITYG